MTKLVYQSVILVAGQQLGCVESYDSLFERVRDLELKASADGLTWLPPIEVTVKGQDDRPIRCLIPPQAIGCIWEIPEDERIEVEEGGG